MIEWGPRVLLALVVGLAAVRGAGCQLGEAIRNLPHDCRTYGCATGECRAVHPDGKWDKNSDPHHCVVPAPPPTTTLPSPPPTPSPTPVPTPTPTPEPLPTPTPGGCVMPPPGPLCSGSDATRWCGGCWTCREDGRWKRHDKACPPECDGGCGPRADGSLPWLCRDKQDYDVRQGHVHRAPPGAPYVVYGCAPTGAPELPGCAGQTCLNARCDRVDCNTGRVLAPAEDGYYGICVPKPCPSPTPTPAVTPTPIPTTPPPGACPALLEVGGSMLQPRNCAPGCVRDGYLGYVINWTATPLISADTGLCAPGRNRCEMPKACQDPRGAYTWLYLPGVFALGICDERSDNPFNCHHKPKAHETGLTYFISCPWGVTPPTPPESNPLCTTHVVDVRADRPVEIKKP